MMMLPTSPAILALLALATVQAPPVFRADVAVVRVDVAVTKDGEAIRGLRAENFEVLEDGQRQPLEAVLEEEAALDAVLVLDMSGSVQGERLAGLREGALAFVDGLGERDRAALICFTEQVSLRIGLTGEFDRLRSAVRMARASGSTAARDAVWSALWLRDSASARRAVVVFSDGIDNMSWLSAQQVVEAARRSEAVVYAVVAAPPDGQPTTTERFLEQVVSATGGRMWSSRTATDLRPAFVDVLRHIRSRYLLAYVPRDPRPGWHALEVRLRGKRGAVLARPGYSR